MKQNNIEIGGWTVEVPPGREQEAQEIWRSLGEYDSHKAMRQAFRNAGFVVEETDDAAQTGRGAPTSKLRGTGRLPDAELPELPTRSS